MGGREGGRQGERDCYYACLPYPRERVQLQNRNEDGEQQEQEIKQNNGGKLLPFAPLYIF